MYAYNILCNQEGTISRGPLCEALPPLSLWQKVSPPHRSWFIEMVFNVKNPEGQLARWLDVIRTYYMEIEHIHGKKHGHADALSKEPECGFDPSTENHTLFLSKWTYILNVEIDLPDAVCFNTQSLYYVWKL